MPKGIYDRQAAHVRHEPDVAPPSRPVRLLQPHGYVTTMWSRLVRVEWAAGEVIFDPEEIAHLRSRGAQLEDVECLTASASQPVF